MNYQDDVLAKLFEYFSNRRLVADVYIVMNILFTEFGFKSGSIPVGGCFWSLSIPIMSSPNWAKYKAASEPMSPAEPVMIAMLNSNLPVISC
jgi:hypothetical protein